MKMSPLLWRQQAAPEEEIASDVPHVLELVDLGKR
jgi:hypothetical protein